MQLYKDRNENRNNVTGTLYLTTPSKTGGHWSGYMGGYDIKRNKIPERKE
jgi:hypothetical protein